MYTEKNSVSTKTDFHIKPGTNILFMPEIFMSSEIQQQSDDLIRLINENSIQCQAQGERS